MATSQVAECPGDGARDRRPAEADHLAGGPIAGDGAWDRDEAEHPAEVPRAALRRREAGKRHHARCPDRSDAGDGQRGKAAGGAEDDPPLTPADEEGR